MDKLPDLLRVHGRADDLTKLAEDKKRLRHSEMEAVIAIQDVCMLAARELEQKDARIKELREALELWDRGCLSGRDSPGCCCYGCITRAALSKEDNDGQA